MAAQPFNQLVVGALDIFADTRPAWYVRDVVWKREHEPVNETVLATALVREFTQHVGLNASNDAERRLVDPVRVEPTGTLNEFYPVGVDRLAAPSALEELAICTDPPTILVEAASQGGQLVLFVTDAVLVLLQQQPERLRGGIRGNQLAIGW